MRFNVLAAYVKGRDVVMAVVLSCMSLSSQLSTIDKGVAACVSAVCFRQSASDQQHEEARRYTGEDVTIHAARHYKFIGWLWQKEGIAGVAQAYYHVRTELGMVNDLLMRRNHIVIPAEMHREILDKIHDGHQEITK